MFKGLFLSVLTFISTVTFCVTGTKRIIQLNFDEERVGAFTSDDLIVYKTYDFGYDRIRNYYENLYGSENVYDLEFVDDVFYNVPNFNQITLNEMYNDEYGLLGEESKKLPIKDTCTLVACMEMVNYYSNVLGQFKSDSNTDELYMKVVNACLKAGCTSRQKGTYDSEADNCVTASFKRFGSGREGNTNWYWLVDNIRDAVRWRSALMLNIGDHSVVVRGLLRYKLTYNYGAVFGSSSLIYKKTQIVEFIHVSEGGNFGPNGALIPADRISNHRDHHQVTWAEK